MVEIASPHDGHMSLLDLVLFTACECYVCTDSYFSTESRTLEGIGEGNLGDVFPIISM